MISENIIRVEENIKNACKRCGRNAGEVTLIAVSKTKPIAMLTEAYEYGCRHFGENKVQELVEKQDAMPKDIKWHMIGHLQRNKVKYLIGKVYLIHSVDSVRLAEEISKEAVKKQTRVNILVEVNIAAEESKFGVKTEDALEFITEISKFPGISIKGLMTIAPYVENAEENRHHFVKLRQLSVDIMMKNIDNVSMDILSMGMTGDYQVAVEEGASYVRVGTGIFG
ncbi:MAG: YggS family pyridoxal phosphate-dependent enzyme, partial [Lachnospiraceae bacterium]|nr:YggS family pyridoxal phosphate-dependent enzyme [Lachnospiraceae bacterium]